MNGNQRKTLAAVFADPTSASIEWAAIESLLIGAGCRKMGGSGSRVRFESKGLVATFHRPHSGKEAKRYQVRDAREYLTGKSMDQWSADVISSAAEMTGHET